MTGRYYHTAPRPTTNRVRCLVCHEEVYSAAGIHPQCALRQDDPPRLKSKSSGSSSTAAGSSNRAVRDSGSAIIAISPVPEIPSMPG